VAADARHHDEDQNEEEHGGAHLSHSGHSASSVDLGTGLDLARLILFESGESGLEVLVGEVRVAAVHGRAVIRAGRPVA
jgi:hypothetical protein